MGKENLTSSFLSKEIKFFQQNLKQIGIIFSLVTLISLLFPGGEALKYSYKINDVTREPSPAESRPKPIKIMPFLWIFPKQRHNSDWLKLFYVPFWADFKVV